MRRARHLLLVRGGGRRRPRQPSLARARHLPSRLTATRRGRSCRFRAIYPGWYTGRAIHIHFKLRHPDGTLTGQLYFPDELTDAIHEREPYRSRPRRDTTNEEDVIYREGGAATLLQPQAEAGRYSANVRLAIERLDHEPTH